MSMTSVFAPIFKSAEQDDGTLMIYGKATGADLDLDQQRCDPEWLKKAMPRWFGTGRIGDVGGNVRMQHDPKTAVGKATEHNVEDDGHYIKAHIVDPLAITKVKSGVFTGLSIGISKPVIEKTTTDEWIRGGDISEISVCDRPCLPTAVFTMCKAAKPGMSMKSDDFDSRHMLVRVEEHVEKSVEPEVRKVAGDPEMAMSLTLADRLPPEQVEKLTSVAEAVVEKATDVDLLDAPNHSQTCFRCSEPGHLWCAPEGFDKDFAVGVVNETIEKASKGVGLGQDESADISGAEQAITAVANLIISEAQALASMPAQDCDIHLLMAAVDALRLFSVREKLEQGALDPDSMAYLAAETDVVKTDSAPYHFATGDQALPYSMTDRGELVKAKYSADELKRMLKDGKAFKNEDGDPSYPIGDKEDLSNAIHAVGRGKGDHDAIRAHIVKRAEALDASDMIPDNWTSSGGSSKSVEPETENTVQVDLTEKMYTLNEARIELGVPTVEVDPEVIAKVADAEIETKTTEPEVEKATSVEEDTHDALVKALTAALEKADNPLRKSFEAIAQSGQESIAKSVSELTERLETVESMATTGGPKLRRTEIETKTAQKSELLRQADYWIAKSEAVQDPDLKKGYADSAADFTAKADALGV